MAAIPLVLGCGDETSAPTPPDPCAGDEGRLLVTADWLNQGLSLLSEPRLLAGCAADTAVVGRIDLAGFPPGPLQIEIAQDGRTAVVSSGPGFFEGEGGALVGSPEVPPGGNLLVVDLLDRVVVHTITTTHVPMGIAITPDGATAFTANFGRSDAPGDTLSVIDLVAGIEREAVVVGARPEQVALSDDGRLGIVNLAGDDTARIFETGDPSGTLSAPIPTGSDPSDVVFVGARALVTNSAGLSYTLIDVTDPSAPTGSAPQELPAAIPYAATRVPGREEVLVSAILGSTKLFRVDMSGAATAVTATIELEGGAFPLGVAVDPSGEHAFVAHPTDHVLSIVDLDSATVRSVAWLSEPGPTYVAVQP